MKRVIGYLAILVGFILIASLKVPTIFEKLKSFLPESMSNFVLYIGLGCFVLGIIILIIFRDSSLKSEREVPIYRGNQIIGYRRY